MLPLMQLAQLRCALELVSAEPAAAPSLPRATVEEGVRHEFAYFDALTGEALSAAEVAGLLPRAVDRAGATLAATREDDDPSVPLALRVTTPAGAGYSLRIEASGSLRYHGCASEVAAVQGERVRRVRVLLVPRSRDVSLRVEAVREGQVRRLPEAGLAGVVLRPDAASEREVEIHPGTCAGEPGVVGGSWCVRSLAEAPGTVGLSALVPGYGLVALTLDGTSAAGSVPVVARVEAHFLPRAVLRAGAGVGVVAGDGASGHLGAEWYPASSTLGMTCPTGDHCVRPLVHLGMGVVPYARTTELVGPGDRVVPDGSTRGSLATLEAGAGVTVFPGGTGDRMRVTALGSLVVVSRGEERDPAHDDLLLSRAASRVGVSAEIFAAYRFAGAFQLFVGGRTTVLPGFGAQGRQFSYLGDAGTTTTLAPLVQLSLVLGLGVEL